MAKRFAQFTPAHQRPAVAPEIQPQRPDDPFAELLLNVTIMHPHLAAFANGPLQRIQQRPEHAPFRQGRGRHWRGQRAQVAGHRHGQLFLHRTQGLGLTLTGPALGHGQTGQQGLPFFHAEHQRRQLIAFQQGVAFSRLGIQRHAAGRQMVHIPVNGALGHLQPLGQRLGGGPLAGPDDLHDLKQALCSTHDPSL